MFNVLTDLFDRVSLHTNVQKTVIMAFRPFYNLCGFPEQAYTQRVTGVGPLYQDNMRQRIQFPNCGVEVEV